MMMHVVTRASQHAIGTRHVACVDSLRGRQKEPSPAATSSLVFVSGVIRSDYLSCGGISVQCVFSDLRRACGDTGSPGSCVSTGAWQCSVTHWHIGLQFAIRSCPKRSGARHCRRTGSCWQSRDYPISDQAKLDVLQSTAPALHIRCIEKLVVEDMLRLHTRACQEFDRTVDHGWRSA